MPVKTVLGEVNTVMAFPAKSPPQGVMVNPPVTPSDPATLTASKFPSTLRGLRKTWLAVKTGGEPAIAPKTATFCAKPSVLGPKVKDCRFKYCQLVK